jgi:hypothetical protein
MMRRLGSVSERASPNNQPTPRRWRLSQPEIAASEAIRCGFFISIKLHFISKYAISALTYVVEFMSMRALDQANKSRRYIGISEK